MTRKQAIQEIEQLFPADGEYPETREIGIRLLEEAKRNVNNWRNLPDAVIFEYLNLCQREEHRQTMKFNRMHRNAY